MIPSFRSCRLLSRSLSHARQIIYGIQQTQAPHQVLHSAYCIHHSEMMTHETRHILHGDGTLNSHSCCTSVVMMMPKTSKWSRRIFRLVSFSTRKRKMWNGRTIFPAFVWCYFLNRHLHQHQHQHHNEAIGIGIHPIPTLPSTAL